ncbi:hypothetical protein MMC09_005172 [Bachmanniomyces sp. S44760]|nr:hypothetical protein [Bachmanniomyces sp. S44760]
MAIPISITAMDHKGYMRLALTLAGMSEPKPTNFRVGAVLVDEEANSILSTGYTLELPGNTHAEQCCFAKYAATLGISEEKLGDVLPHATVLYTTMEPCVKRLSGHEACVDRIIKLKGGESKGGIRTVYVGVTEPETFVGPNEGQSKLQNAGLSCVHIEGLEDDILKVATAGHTPNAKEKR